jgi:hypothetical protein
MVKRVLVGYGIDVDAVSGWWVSQMVLSIFKEIIKESEGSTPRMEALPV